MLPPLRPGRAATPELVARRAGLAGAAAAGLWRTDPPAVAIMPAEMRALRYDPRGPSRATIVHVHGGAFRLGMPEQIAPFAAALALRCAVTIICPAYRLAPEHPFPAALHDGQAVLAAHAGGPLILSGDSAGGGIAAGLAALTPKLAGLLLFSPWLDLTVESECFRDNAASDPLFSAEAAREAADLYLQGWPPRDPIASPLFAEIGGFPPTFVNAGAGEVLAADARRLHARLIAAGVSSVLQIVPGMAHVAVTRGADLPGARVTFDAAAAFIDDLLDRVR